MNISPSLTFHSAEVLHFFRSEMSLFWATYRWNLLFIHSVTQFVLTGEFSPFTFKVITDRLHLLAFCYLFWFCFCSALLFHFSLLLFTHGLWAFFSYVLVLVLFLPEKQSDACEVCRFYAVAPEKHQPGPLPVKGCLLTLIASLSLERIYIPSSLCMYSNNWNGLSQSNPWDPYTTLCTPQGQGLPSHQDRKLQLYSGQSLAFPKVQLLLLFTKNMCTPFPQLPNLWLARFFLLVGTQWCTLSTPFSFSVFSLPEERVPSLCSHGNFSLAQLPSLHLPSVLLSASNHGKPNSNPQMDFLGD